MSYWTGIWEPDREAISKEVSWLRHELSPSSRVVSFTPQSSRLVTSERVVRIHYRRWLWLRAAAVALERSAAVTHIFGGVGSVGHFLTLLGRRPILLTALIPGAPLAPELYAKVSRFVVESRGLSRTLIGAGVDSRLIETIYPALDLSRYTPSAPPATGTFRVLFASTPASVEEIDARGIGLLIELARIRPDVEFIVAWRQWGAVGAARQELARRQPPANFRIEQGDVADMAALYASVHATVCCFEAGHGKSAPNSVIEALACGRPALLADTCGIADLVGEWGAGVITERSAAALGDGIDRLRQHYDRAARQARRLAEAEFNATRAVARYARLYGELSAA